MFHYFHRDKGSWDWLAAHALFPVVGEGLTLILAVLQRSASRQMGGSLGFSA